MKNVQTFSVDLEGREFTFETGNLANLAQGSCVVKYGESVLLATAGMSESPRQGIDFFPMMCDFESKFYAAGKIKGSRFMKREGRPPESAILIARMMDRPLRPMFPKGMQNDVQLIATMLQTDGTRSLAATAITGASMAVQLSGIPIEAPVSAVRVGMKEDGSFFLDPTFEESEKGDLDLVIAGSEEAIMMVEAGANLVSNDKMIEAFEFAHTHIKKLCVAQREFAAKHEVVAKEPQFRQIDPAAEVAVDKFLTDSDFENISGGSKKELHTAIHAAEQKLLDACADQIENDELKKGDLLEFFTKKFKKVLRNQILKTGKRLDGRGAEEIRTLNSEVGIFPRLHGTGLFERGDTQALTVLTVGAPSDEQILDDPDRPEYKKQYIHHYNFPPYSVGEVRPLRGTGRREIGHGTLAERALEYVIPKKEENFPYTLRLVSEILACNGSSSMASVCGSTLALMDGGIPIKSAISGIAMGLVTDEDGNYKILSDIQAQEDFCGDMDLKVCGDENGLTALQMDIKLKGLDMSLLKEALAQATVGRTEILKSMKSAIPEVRSEMSSFAPRVTSFHINPEYIRVVIGKGGETIQGLCADFDVKIDIEDDGLVMVSSVDGEKAKGAIAAIKALTYEPEVGDVFENATVKNVMDFGAFVEYLPGKEALVHVSEIANHRVENVSDELKEGQKITVKLIGVDKMGRTQLSMKAVEDK
ncbi:polyribonucleotide nucleotidyltransferase [bacterium]|jgi:polyribonucleotide nucleotidyltransferase|nr:polyribonucleotide nucleotidyltransferase [bacterium]MBT6831642.1 polyribonucleotide nucleotidyltransferase [bacterium]MBT6996288.1 polyribonucleotide nucleotidyltransferase [bacterium]MBT7772966.1 polyribonucleotide nucleotidyltransferase [bacterium]